MSDFPGLNSTHSFSLHKSPSSCVNVALRGSMGYLGKFLSKCSTIVVRF